MAPDLTETTRPGSSTDSSGHSAETSDRIVPHPSETVTDFLELRCFWPTDRDDVLALVLESAPILGAQTGGVADGHVELKVFMTKDRVVEAALLCEVLSSSGALRVQIASFEGRDWLAEYRASVKPFAVGERWWIDPHPDTPTPAPPGRLRLAVEPRSAFGSGTHESTQLALCLIEGIGMRGQRVLDVGTGSGILAMAAAALGARWVVGLDIDPQAGFVARQTLTQQDMALEVAVFAGEIDAVARGTIDLVLCNMISSRFLPLLADLRDVLTPAGRLVLAGFLGSEDELVREAVGAAGLVVEAVTTLGEWSGMTAVLRGQ